MWVSGHRRSTNTTGSLSSRPPEVAYKHAGEWKRCNAAWSWDPLGRDRRLVWERVLRPNKTGQPNTFDWSCGNYIPFRNLERLDAISLFFCFHPTLLPWREWRYELHFFGPGNYGGWQALYFTWKCDIVPCNYWDLYGFIICISLLVSRPGYSRFHYNMEHVKKLQWIYVFAQM